MLISNVNCLSCGSGGAGLLLRGDNEDHPNFAPALALEPLKDFEVSGMLAAGICDDDTACVWGPMGFIRLSLPVEQVACGWAHSLFLSADQVYAYGKGSHGQLGVPSTTCLSEPLLLPLSDCLSVGCGFRTSFVVTSKSYAENGVFVFGENRKYQLGLGHSNNCDSPTLHPSLPILTKIRGGNKHSAGFAGNTLYCWGQNNCGQLGVQAQEAPVPLTIEFLEELCKVDCGWFSTGVLTSTKKLLMTGRGSLGQVGTGKFEDSWEFQLILPETEEFALGSEHALAISNHQSWSWGWNEHGNLGTGGQQSISTPTALSIENPVSVKAGGASSFIITI